MGRKGFTSFHGGGSLTNARSASIDDSEEPIDTMPRMQRFATAHVEAPRLGGPSR
jgi:hypothetical protein